MASNTPVKIYFGETCCQAKHSSGLHAGHPCTHKAYYKQGTRYLCGAHSGNNRTRLPKNPNAAEFRQEQLQKHEETIEAAKLKNQKLKLRGKVSCSRLGMRTRPEDIEGFLKVFPNNKHQGRKDGFGCSSLSPMKLGPVVHCQKGLPTCKLLENYHQFNKVYNVEEGKDKKPTKTFYKEQLKGYKSSTGCRRKYTAKSVIPGRTTTDKLRTLYSIHVDKQGNERRYGYTHSRYFYCHFYEQLVRENADLATLRQMLQDGTNLQIVGYDGFNVTKDLMHHYTDPMRPFGHELVLYTILTVDDPEQYPWNIHYEMHSEMYPTELKPDYLKETRKPNDEEDDDNDEAMTTSSTSSDSDPSEAN